MKFAVVAAVTNGFGLGLANRLPWHPRRLQLDLAFFKLITTGSFAFNGESLEIVDCNSGNAVILGRKTWESLPPKYRPLEDRTNIVVSSNPQYSR